MLHCYELAMEIRPALHMLYVQQCVQSKQSVANENGYTSLPNYKVAD